MRTSLLFLSILFIVPFLSYQSVLNAQNRFDVRLYKCYVTSDLKGWESSIADMEKELKLNNSAENHFQLLHAQYGIIGFLLGLEKTSRAEYHIGKAEKEVDFLLKIPAYKSQVLAMQAALCAYKVSINWYKVFYLGPKCFNLVDEALKAGPENVYAVIEKANILHYAPKILGGNPMSAVKYYRKSIDILMEENGGIEPKTWWFLNSYVQMGLAAQKAGNYYLARNIFLKILNLAPNFIWVRDSLLPRLEVKMNLKS